MRSEAEIKERIKDLNVGIGVALSHDIHSLVAEYKLEIEILNWILNESEVSNESR